MQTVLDVTIFKTLVLLFDKQYYAPFCSLHSIPFPPLRFVMFIRPFRSNMNQLQKGTKLTKITLRTNLTIEENSWDNEYIYIYTHKYTFGPYIFGVIFTLILTFFPWMQSLKLNFFFFILVFIVILFMKIAYMANRVHSWHTECLRGH